MVAGRELDALVAEKVMGWERIVMKDKPGAVSWPHPPKGFDVNHNRWSIIPHYSTDIAAAWEVVEKLAPEFEWILENDVKDGGWSAIIYKWEGTSVVSSPIGRSDADTAPHAICLAALAAVGAVPPAQEDGA